MAPRFLKKLKTTVKDLVTKIGRALSGSSSKHFILSSHLYTSLTP
jgi:hypothetical protein